MTCAPLDASLVRVERMLLMRIRLRRGSPGSSSPRFGRHRLAIRNRSETIHTSGWRATVTRCSSRGINVEQRCRSASSDGSDVPVSTCLTKVQPFWPAWMYCQPFLLATSRIPGSSARDVESPASATTGEARPRGSTTVHHENSPTDGLSPGHAVSLVSVTWLATDVELIEVASKASAATTTTPTTATAANFRGDSRTHGNLPARIGRSRT